MKYRVLVRCTECYGCFDGREVALIHGDKEWQYTDGDEEDVPLEFDSKEEAENAAEDASYFFGPACWRYRVTEVIEPTERNEPSAPAEEGTTK